jgi:hypothetical protein
MSPLAMSVIVFACVFGGALAGMSIRAFEKTSKDAPDWQLQFQVQFLLPKF